MVQKLIQQIITLLRDGFAGVISDPSDHILAGPTNGQATEALPMIALSMDKLAVSRNAKETGSSQPRPQEMRQEIPVNTSSPQGPYPLLKTPLEKSLDCKIFYEKGALTERRIVLMENKNFTVDYQSATILFSFDISEASDILLQYSFVGVFVIQEFQQDFLMEVYDNNMADVEKWASLAHAIITTNHDELIANFNFTDTAQYVANQFLSAHTINRIELITGVPDASRNEPGLRLTYKVQGQIKLVKEIVGGFGIIEKIHSPGRISDHPVDIEIGHE